MKQKHFIRILLVLTAGICLLSACGGKAAEVTEASEAQESSRTVPASLQSIEAAAEDIIDIAPGGNWEKIGTDITDISKAWNSYQSQASQDGVSQDLQETMSSAIEKLETASASKDAAATMQGSNDVSAAVVEIFALYHPAVPVQISRLDVLERQIILDVAAHDYAAASMSFAKVKSAWEEVKPLVLEHNGKDVAAAFEASLARQESELNARDDVALTSDAKDALELVDALELLY